jgi:hypothetical protein
MGEDFVKKNPAIFTKFYGEQGFEQNNPYCFMFFRKLKLN